MRRRYILALVPLLSGFGGACGEPQAAPVDRIEIRVSGWRSVDIAVDRNGAGRFHISEPLPDGRGGSFALPARQFQRLLERLEPYLRQSVPETEASGREFVERGCPAGVPFVTDAGAVYLR